MSGGPRGEPRGVPGWPRAPAGGPSRLGVTPRAPCGALVLRGVSRGTFRGGPRWTHDDPGGTLRVPVTRRDGNGSGKVQVEQIPARDNNRNYKKYPYPRSLTDKILYPYPYPLGTVGFRVPIGYFNNSINNLSFSHID